MPPVQNDKSQRLVLCLVADEEVIERYPEALCDLQEGLGAEAIDIVLVISEHSRARDLARGSTTIITHRELKWPFAPWLQRNIEAMVRNTIDSGQQEGSVVVHGFSLTSAPLAASIASATDAELIVNVFTTAGLEIPERAHWLQRTATLIAPTDAIHCDVKAAPWVTQPVKKIRQGIRINDAPAAFADPYNSAAMLFAGPLTDEAGVDVLLKAFARVLRRRPSLQLFILGKGPADSALRQLARSLGISLNVTFTGRLKNLRGAMKAADIYCLPQAYNDYREEPIHAMATGLAIVAAEGSLCEGLVDGETAVLFPAGDENQLANQILNLLQNPEVARTLAATAQAYARRHHSVHRMVADYLEIYRELAGRKTTLPIDAGQSKESRKNKVNG